MTPQEYIANYADVCEAAQAEIVKYPTIGTCWLDTVFPDWLVRCYANTGLNEADRAAWLTVAAACATHAESPESVEADLLEMASAPELRGALAALEHMLKVIGRQKVAAAKAAGLVDDEVTIQLYADCLILSNIIRINIACPVA